MDATADSEFAFELALCARLEATREWILGRQLGAAVASPGGRVVDVCAVVPGPDDAVDARTRITSEEIPARAIESDAGAGTATYWKDAFACRPELARRVTDRAIEVGFFERERRGGREYVRQPCRYPEWVDALVGIENKPDLGTPGELERQLRHDVSLGLFDEVVLATESYVTRAHLNRLPDAVGVWRFDPGSGTLETVREATPLDVERPGVEPVEYRPLRTDVRVVSAAEKARVRRRLAERAYGKGWRTYEPPGCANATTTADGRPRCRHYGRVVNPAADCGRECPGFEAAAPPPDDSRRLRAERTPWVADPDGVTREQTGLDRFG